LPVKTEAKKLLSTSAFYSSAVTSNIPFRYSRQARESICSSSMHADRQHCTFWSSIKTHALISQTGHQPATATQDTSWLSSRQSETSPLERGTVSLLTLPDHHGYTTTTLYFSYHYAERIEYVTQKML